MKQAFFYIYIYILYLYFYIQRNKYDTQKNNKIKKKRKNKPFVGQKHKSVTAVANTQMQFNQKFYDVIKVKYV